MSYASLKTLRPFFTNKCGRLLAGGKVYTYEVGTLTPKATYKDAAGLTENTNPIALDVSGEADIYINSDYRFQIFDRDGVLVDDVDSVAPTQRISSAFLIDESGFNQAQINATKEDTLNKGVAGGYASLDGDAKIPDDQISVINDLATSDDKKPLSAAMGKKLQDEKFAISDLVNDLTTGGTDKALTAEAGKLLLGMFANSKTVNGYQKLPDGLIVQWGITGAYLINTIGFTGESITYPISFPNGTLGIVSSLGGTYDGLTAAVVLDGTATTSSFIMYFSNTRADQSVYGRWIAIGH